MNETDVNEAAELEKMGKLAAEQQKSSLEVAALAVRAYEELEADRAKLSAEFDAHQTLVHNGHEGTMTVVRMKEAADRLERIGKRMRSLEAEYPDLASPYGRTLMTAPDFVEAGIAKPDDSISGETLKERYGFDAEALEEEEPQRPRTRPFGTPEPQINPEWGNQPLYGPSGLESSNRTEEDVRRNEEAAKRVVEAQGQRPHPYVVDPALTDEAHAIRASGAVGKIPPFEVRRETVEPSDERIPMPRIPPAPEDGYWWVKLFGKEERVARLYTDPEFGERMLEISGWNPVELRDFSGEFISRVPEPPSPVARFAEGRVLMRSAIDGDEALFERVVTTMGEALRAWLHDIDDWADAIQSPRSAAKRALRAMLWEERKPTPDVNLVPIARREMRAAFEADPYFFETYVANVAMLLYDLDGHEDFKVKEERESAAKAILKRIFWD